MKISRDFPSGNIRVISVEGHHAVIDNEIRDTTTDWFYWCFKAEFPEAGQYTFHFASVNRLCTRGPAYSLDDGVTWKWIYDSTWESTQDFSYDCPVAGQRVMFCMGMQYLQSDWERFVAEVGSLPFFKTGVLCQSRKGRNVEMAEIREGNPAVTLLLTSRHHCGEMMATHAMEGILRYALETPAFRRKIGIIAVPFVDKDGVEDGDQGKNRAPYDHCRDYMTDSIYPETDAIRKMIADRKIDMVQDMHCPWLRGGPTNEMAYMVGDDHPVQSVIMNDFGKILEEESVPEAPYFAEDNVAFGKFWNTGANYTQGWTLKKYGGVQPGVRYSQTFEIPFANFRDVTIDHEAMLHFGASIARAYLRFVTMKGWA